MIGPSKSMRRPSRHDVTNHRPVGQKRGPLGRAGRAVNVNGPHMTTKTNHSIHQKNVQGQSGEVPGLALLFAPRRGAVPHCIRGGTWRYLGSHPGGALPIIPKLTFTGQTSPHYGQGQAFQSSQQSLPTAATIHPTVRQYPKRDRNPGRLQRQADARPRKRLERLIGFETHRSEGILDTTARAATQQQIHQASDSLILMGVTTLASVSAKCSSCSTRPAFVPSKDDDLKAGAR